MSDVANNKFQVLTNFENNKQNFLNLKFSRLIFYKQSHLMKYVYVTNKLDFHVLRYSEETAVLSQNFSFSQSEWH